MEGICGVVEYYRTNGAFGEKGGASTQSCVFCLVMYSARAGGAKIGVGCGWEATNASELETGSSV